MTAINSRLAAALMCGNAALAFWTWWASEGPSQKALVTAGTIAGFLLLAALLIALRPRGVIITLARGIAIMNIIGVVFLGLISGALFALGTGFNGVTGLLLGVAIVAVQVKLLRCLPSPHHMKWRRIVSNTLGTVTVFFLFLFVFYGGEVAGAMVDIGGGYARYKAEDLMLTTVVRAQRCAIEYAAQRQAYPASLAAMGSPGTGCLEDKQASGTLGKITLRYIAPRTETGFVLLASAPVGPDSGETRLVYADETGILRKGDEVPDPAALPPVQGGMHSVRALRACAEIFRQQKSARYYPATWRELFDVREPDPTLERNRWLGCSFQQGTSITFDTTQSRTANIGTYRPLGDSLQPSDYALEIRPRRYGIDGVRSILATARGRVHSTVEDRPANETDPVVPECAYDPGDGSCAPAPGGIAARVDVSLPDTVAVGDTFTVVIRDARPAEERDRPYQYHVQCNFRRYADPPEPPASDAFTEASTARCVVDGDRTDAGYSAIRVWVRDYATSHTYVLRRAVLRRNTS